MSWNPYWYSPISGISVMSYPPFHYLFCSFFFKNR
ncbi:hypothetical protein NT06LI_2642, partial [Listeria innocua FSL J1-023]